MKENSEKLNIFIKKIKTIFGIKLDQQPVLKKTYHPLTPRNDVDDDGVYSEMLTYALKDESIKNIAVTGPYGSGKSSVLCTFQKENKNEWKYLNISLATFKDATQKQVKPDGADKALDSNDIEIEAIEKSILQQLFYAVKQEELPRSRLKRIIEVKTNTVNKWVLFILLWIFYGLIVFFPDNKYPLDFSNLHSNFGVIYEIFNNIKNKEINKQLVAINKSIEDTDNILDFSQKETLNTVRELRQVYLSEIYSKIPMQALFNMNGYGQARLAIQLFADNHPIDINNLSGDIEFQKIEQSTGMHWTISTTSTPSFTLANIESEIAATRTYKQRESAILNKGSDQHSEILHDRAVLISKKELLKNATFKDILNEITNFEMFDLDIHSLLLQYLIRNGYIAEDYPDYISYFFDSVINLLEKDFARKVMDLSPPKFDTKLVHIDELILRFLTPAQFLQPSILNFDLADYLIVNQSRYPKLYENIFHQLSIDNEYSLKFIFEFIAKDRNLQIFINEIAQVRHDFWNDIYRNFEQKKLDVMLNILITNIYERNITNLNTNNDLTDYLAEKADFIDFVKKHFPTEDTYIKWLDDLNVKFSFLSCTDDDVEFLNKICELNFYKINKNMVSQIVLMNNEAASRPLIQTQLDTKPYSTLLDKAPKYLIDQVNIGLNLYVSEVVLQSTDVLNENVDALLILVNSNDVVLENKAIIVEKNQTLFSKIIDVSDKNLWCIVFKYNKVLPSWDSILEYYFYVEENFDNNIVSFLNSEHNYLELSKSKIDASEFGKREEAILAKFEIALFECNDISDKSFESLLKSIHYQKNALNITALSLHKVNALTQGNILSLTLENVDSLRTKGTDCVVNFIAKNSAVFVNEKPNSINLNVDELEVVLESSLFLDEQKKIIFERDAISHLAVSKRIMKAVTNIFERLSIGIPSDLFSIIFDNTQTVEEKIKLLIPQIKFMDDVDITMYLSNLGDPYSEIVTAGSHKLENKTINRILLDALYKKSYISEPIDKILNIKFFRISQTPEAENMDDELSEK